MNPQKKDINKKNTQNNRSTSVQKPNKFLNYLIWIFLNTIAGILCYFLIFQCIDEQKGYNWAYYSLMKQNYKLIKKHPNLTLEEKYGSKIGFDYAFIKHIIDNTPDDAVILYPPADIFFQKDKEKKFRVFSPSFIYAAKFLYPRKIVLPKDIETSKYGKQITHVAIVYGWGYQYLEYTVPNQVEFTVMPIKLPEQQIEQTNNNNNNNK